MVFVVEKEKHFGMKIRVIVNVNATKELLEQSVMI
jgi:hypothetical protein